MARNSFRQGAAAFFVARAATSRPLALKVIPSWKAKVPKEQATLQNAVHS